MMGIDPKTVAENLLSWNVDIIGTNCGNGFGDMVLIVAEMRSVNPDIPILVQANAGLPKLDGEKILYPETPDMAAQIVPKLVKAGANIIGGCCGTTPAHIREIRKTLLQYFPDKLYAANN